MGGTLLSLSKAFLEHSVLYLIIVVHEKLRIYTKKGTEILLVTSAFFLHCIEWIFLNCLLVVYTPLLLRRKATLDL